MTVVERIKKIAADMFEINEDMLRPETTLGELGLDSLDKIEFMFALEEEFKIRIPDREVKINTVQDLIDSVVRFTAEQNVTV